MVAIVVTERGKHYRPGLFIEDQFSVSAIAVSAEIEHRVDRSCDGIE
jgi:hypothetical protein